MSWRFYVSGLVVGFTNTQLEWNVQEYGSNIRKEITQFEIGLDTFSTTYSHYLYRVLNAGAHYNYSLINHKMGNQGPNHVLPFLVSYISKLTISGLLLLVAQWSITAGVHGLILTQRPCLLHRNGADLLLPYMQEGMESLCLNMMESRPLWQIWYAAVFARGNQPLCWTSISSCSSCCSLVVWLSNHKEGTSLLHSQPFKVTPSRLELIVNVHLFIGRLVEF